MLTEGQNQLSYFIAVASYLVRSSPDRAVLVRALARDTVVFLGNSIYTSPSASLHPGVLGTGELSGKPTKSRGSDLRYTSILSTASRNIPRRFMLQKPG